MQSLFFFCSLFNLKFAYILRIQNTVFNNKTSLIQILNNYLSIKQSLTKICNNYLISQKGYTYIYLLLFIKDFCRFSYYNASIHNSAIARAEGCTSWRRPCRYLAICYVFICQFVKPPIKSAGDFKGWNISRPPESTPIA